MAQTAAAAGGVGGFPADSYSSNGLIVGLDRSTSVSEGRDSISPVAGAAIGAAGPRSLRVRVEEGHSLAATARAIAKRPGVSFVKPDYLARISEDPPATPWLPNDPGGGTTAGGWQRLQWNFTGRWGVDVLPAWRKLRAIKRSGGRGAVVAVIDTGVAFESRGKYRGSPDLRGVRVKSPRDFLARSSHPYDRNGHGTHVASTIFAQTNDGIGVTGLAYGATMIPIRALNSRGYGNESVVARAIRYAADRRADVINLSVEFDVRLSAADLPLIVSAMRYAKRKGSLIVAAAGNQSVGKVAYPARSGYALAVGATTASGCLAGYSDHGRGLDLVAPGGGSDSLEFDSSDPITDRENCKASNPALPIYQVTFVDNLRRFFLPGTYQGTSMAAPHVSGVAALVIASGIIGRRPGPAALQKHLESTAVDLGAAGLDSRYGHGLINAADAVGAPR